MPKKGEYTTSYMPEATGREAEPVKPKSRGKAKGQQPAGDAFADHDAIAAHGLVMRKPGDLTPYENNPRKNDAAVDAVAESIREFGFKVPLVIDGAGVVVCGHTRLKAAKRLGLAEVPCVIADDLTPEQIRAFRLADNKVGEIAEWDMDALGAELAEIENINMEAFGFDLEMFEEEPEVTEDAGVPEYVAPVCSTGQIWQLGDHRLLCGDSTDPEQIASLMREDQADMLLTEPGCNEPLDDERFWGFLVEAFNAATAYLKPGGVFYIWHPEGQTFEYTSACRGANLDVRQNIIWVKDVCDGGAQDYKRRHEPCIYGWIGADHYFSHSRAPKEAVIIEPRPDIEKMGKAELKALCGRLRDAMEQQETSALHEDRPEKAEGNASKPVKLFARQISNSSRPGEIVLDTFGGSGTTIIAAEQLQRRARLVEIDPDRCNEIIARWEAFTGQQAELIYTIGEER